jgi:hypothetical protein
MNRPATIFLITISVRLSATFSTQTLAPTGFLVKTTPVVGRREVPERIVLTEQRRTTVEALADWLGTATQRQAKNADEYGRMVRPQFVAFHGELNTPDPVGVRRRFAGDDQGGGDHGRPGTGDLLHRLRGRRTGRRGVRRGLPVAESA